MISPKIYRVLGVLSAATLQLHAADTLNGVLARMDKSAESFESMTASLNQLNHTEVINDNEKLTATVKMKRTKNGIVGRVDFAEPNRRIVGIRERQLQIFYPKSNTVELYDVGKYGDQLDEFLLLGFATSGKELQKNYKVRLIGTETVNGKVTTHLELTPKSKQAEEMFKKADIWLAQDANYPVQERIDKNGQDYTLITYSDVKLNPPLSEKDLEIALPPGVRTVTPQK
jgi:outer membrane lipoprotein-sorting protein